MAASWKARETHHVLPVFRGPHKKTDFPGGGLISISLLLIFMSWELYPDNFPCKDNYPGYFIGQPPKTTANKITNFFTTFIFNRLVRKFHRISNDAAQSGDLLRYTCSGASTYCQICLRSPHGARLSPRPLAHPRYENLCNIHRVSTADETL